MSDHKDDPKGQDAEQDEKATGPILDMVKKVFAVGVGAAFLTEESIRGYLSEFKLPKDALNFILQSANKGKEEVVNRVSKEIGGLFSHIDIVKEVSRFAETHRFKISAEIEVLPKNKHPEK